MGFPKQVRIREVGPREGFQTLSQLIVIEQKLELIDLLSSTGVQDIELTSMVRPDKVPQMADAEAIIQTYNRVPHVRYTALYLNQTGFRRAEELSTVGGRVRLDNQAWINISPSDTFLRKNANTSLQEIVQSVPSWITLFKSHGKDSCALMVSNAFGCTDEGEMLSERVVGSIEQVSRTLAGSKMGLREICLADTVGMGNPEQVRRLVALVRERYPGVPVSLHLHDTRGTGMANVYAGLLEGVDTFDASVGGLGGCPFAKGAAGNVPTEDVAYLCEALGIETNLDLGQYVKAARLAEKIVGASLPGKLARVWGSSKAVKELC